MWLLICHQYLTAFITNSIAIVLPAYRDFRNRHTVFFPLHLSPVLSPLWLSSPSLSSSSLSQSSLSAALLPSSPSISYYHILYLCHHHCHHHHHHLCHYCHFFDHPYHQHCCHPHHQYLTITFITNTITITFINFTFSSHLRSLLKIVFLLTKVLNAASCITARLVKEKITDWTRTTLPSEYWTSLICFGEV